MANHKKVEKTIFNDGFVKGMRIGMKLEMIGWVPTNINFPDHQSNTDIWWVTECNIVPNSFIWKEERYEIPEDKRKFKISKLYVNQNGQLRCEGNHPNVSGSKVCMGDLQIDFTKTVSEIQDALDRARSLLDIVNYDSAYTNVNREELVKCSIKVRALSQHDTDVNGYRIKTKPKIKEVSFDDSDDEDDEEEVGEEEITNNNVNITAITHNDEVIAEVELLNNNVPAGSEYSIVEEEQISTPTYEVSDNRELIETIRVVDEVGERRPIVFYTSNGDTVTLQTPPTNVVDSRELSLGDSNLL
jgi:hypothetical protein